MGRKRKGKKQGGREKMMWGRIVNLCGAGTMYVVIVGINCLRTHFVYGLRMIPCMSAHKVE